MSGAVSTLRPSCPTTKESLPSAVAAGDSWSPAAVQIGRPPASTTRPALLTRAPKISIPLVAALRPSAHTTSNPVPIGDDPSASDPSPKNTGAGRAGAALVLPSHKKVPRISGDSRVLLGRRGGHDDRGVHSELRSDQRVDR